MVMGEDALGKVIIIFNNIDNNKNKKIDKIISRS